MSTQSPKWTQTPLKSTSKPLRTMCCISSQKVHTTGRPQGSNISSFSSVLANGRPGESPAELRDVFSWKTTAYSMMYSSKYLYSITFIYYSERLSKTTVLYLFCIKFEVVMLVFEKGTTSPSSRHKSHGRPLGEGCLPWVGAHRCKCSWQYWHEFKHISYDVSCVFAHLNNHICVIILYVIIVECIVLA